MVALQRCPCYVMCKTPSENNCNPRFWFVSKLALWARMEYTVPFHFPFVVTMHCVSLFTFPFVAGSCRAIEVLCDPSYETSFFLTSSVFSTSSSPLVMVFSSSGYVAPSLIFFLRLSALPCPSVLCHSSPAHHPPTVEAASPQRHLLPPNQLSPLKLL
jgi:hypothetical protein